VRWPNGGGLVHQEASVEASAVESQGQWCGRGLGWRRQQSWGRAAWWAPKCESGSHTTLHYSASLQNCRVGSNCILHQGVRVGAEGFGFYVDEKGVMVKKPQPMGVIIGDSVEIGANSCVDRGSWRDTTIGDHTKIDNLVQIGHNVVIGRCCIICGQAGLGGSSTIGDFVVLAGPSRGS